MNQIILILLFITFYINSLSQKYDRDTICFGKPMTINPYRSIKNVSDTSASYKAILCETRTDVGIRFEIGISKYYYNEKTEQWLGNHGGPNFNFILTANKLNFGLRFKPWTINPKTELIFNSDTLPTYADLNPIKIDYYVGYSFDFNNNISIEPFLGFSQSIFSVINEDVLKKTYSIPNALGLITGVAFNKYFRIKEYEYVALFVNLGYSFVNYKKMHESLGVGYFEWTVGVAYKVFFSKKFFRKIE